VWHTPLGQPYWNERAYYAFSSDEISIIESATETLYGLFVAAAQHVIDHDRLGEFGIPACAHDAVRQAWRARPPSLDYGRFDLGYDGVGPPKLFEFNCDTPTSLVEAAVVQWDWKEDVFPALDQFNSLHDRLVDRWRMIGADWAPGLVHFTYQEDDTGEDAVTVAYLRDTAREAGLTSEGILIGDLGWDGEHRQFVDLRMRPITRLYHLYPWEWLVAESFAEPLLESLRRTSWIEPIWKMMWSTKAILPILWELFEGHPNLLPASREPPAAGDYVRKPLLSREGANVTLYRDGNVAARSSGPYGGEGSVYQALFPLPDLDGAHPVLGSWVVGGVPAGLGIREGGLITGDTARFAPHVIAD